MDESETQATLDWRFSFGGTFVPSTRVCVCRSPHMSINLV